MRYFITFLTITTLLTSNFSFGQNSKNYSYLIDCFKNSSTEKGERTINGIGNVEEIALSSNELNETGLLYFEIPKNKKGKSLVKLAELVTNDYVITWKNNSKVLLNQKYENTNACIIDLRLHIKIENIYMQVIVINDGEKIYQIMCFRDTADDTYFNSLIVKIKEQNCL
ncbi:hypothetical protein [Flavobacterium sp.]|uniref:hypothetical protein n=1 Tax=Flavobacterium sp. TaxID=239 RepID=UPI00261F60BF|nr:hypothetical protein [Flavobacterium sp.]